VFEKLREWKRVAKRDTVVAYRSLRDPRAPWYVKALAAAMALYAISPVDLIQTSYLSTVNWMTSW
jgi:uncharacterized membrane protein YkvA (DUF1232 family)